MHVFRSCKEPPNYHITKSPGTDIAVVTRPFDLKVTNVVPLLSKGFKSCVSKLIILLLSLTITFLKSLIRKHLFLKLLVKQIMFFVMGSKVLQTLSLTPGLINLDFADETVMANKGNALMGIVGPVKNVLLLARKAILFTHFLKLLLMAEDVIVNVIQVLI